ncbi:hypothetical protein HFN54_35430 [Rhizobium leguminosarum]|nr:hypothetical protein [Rhizobium leguminosarum]
MRIESQRILSRDARRIQFFTFDIGGEKPVRQSRLSVRDERLGLPWPRRDDAVPATFFVSEGSNGSTLATAWGGTYVSDFIDRGRVKRVYVQSDADFRMQPNDLDRWHVRNRNGDIVRFSAFSTTEWICGSPRLERYNGASAVQIEGSPASGVSFGVYRLP